MKKKIIVVVLALAIVLNVYGTALAENFGLITGDWALQYRTQFSGNTAGITVQAKNTSSDKTIYYVTTSLSSTTGEVIFAQTDPMLDFHPGLTVTLNYTAGIPDEYKGVPLIMQVTMSYTIAGAVDGTATTDVTFGEAPATATPTEEATATPTATATDTPPPSLPPETATPTPEITPEPETPTPAPTEEPAEEQTTEPAITNTIAPDDNAGGEDIVNADNNAASSFPIWVFIVFIILALIIAALLVVLIISVKKANEK